MRAAVFSGVCQRLEGEKGPAASEGGTWPCSTRWDIVAGRLLRAAIRKMAAPAVNADGRGTASAVSQPAASPCPAEPPGDRGPFTPQRDAILRVIATARHRLSRGELMGHWEIKEVRQKQ